MSQQAEKLLLIILSSQVLWDDTVSLSQQFLMFLKDRAGMGSLIQNISG